MAPADDAPIDLEELVRELYESDIYVGVQTNGLGIVVWIDDQVHGRRIGHTFEPRCGDALAQRGAASRWLHTKALELFPASSYASRRSGESRRDYLLPPNEGWPWSCHRSGTSSG